MFARIHTVIALTGLSLCSVCSVLSAAPPQNPLDQIRISPAELVQQRTQLGLSDEQVQKIQRVATEAGQAAQALSKQVERAAQALAASLTKTDNHDTIVQAADAFFDLQKQQQLQQLKMFIQLRKVLTKDQIEFVRRNLNRKRTQPNQATARQLMQRIRAIQNAAAQQQRSGRNVRPISKLLDRIGGLMRDQRVDEVMTLVQQAEQFLQRREDPAALNDPARTPAKRPGTQVVETSFQKLQAQVTGMKQAEVAWRKIDWRTCLLDGLRESREQHKPVMLWVFIDRPIDDERC